MDSSLFLLCSCLAAICFITILGTLLFILYKKFRSVTASFSSPPNWKHHVYSSYCAKDVSKTFLLHLQREFISMGIAHNGAEMMMNKSVVGSSDLTEAIRGSRIAIVIFSRNYASSSSCLSELAEIVLKCRDEFGQVVVVPVFYGVFPTDVRNLTGDFGRCFEETCAGKTKEVIGRWIQALAKVTVIDGFSSHNWLVVPFWFKNRRQFNYSNHVLI